MKQKCRYEEGKQGQPYSQPYGQQNNAPYVYNRTEPMSGLAIAGFIVGIVGFFIFGIILGIIGVVLSAVAFSEINMGKRGKGFAIAGVIISLIDVIAMGLILSSGLL